MVERRFVKPIAHSCLVSPHSKAVLSLGSPQSDPFRPQVPFLYAGHQRFHSQGSTFGHSGSAPGRQSPCAPVAGVRGNRIMVPRRGVILHDSGGAGGTVKILRRPGCQPTAGLRSLTALTAVALTLVFLAAACTRSGSVGAGGLADIGRRPHTTVGALIFSPPRDATAVSQN